MSYTGINITGCNSPASGASGTSFAGTFDTTATSVDNHDHTTGKGTPITSDAIEDLAITTAKLTNLALGTSDIPANAVTFSKLFARTTHATAATEGNVLETAAISYNCVAPVIDVPSLTGSIVCSGRPVLILLHAAAPSGPQNSYLSASVSSSPYEELFSGLDFYRGTTQLNTGQSYLLMDRGASKANTVLAMFSSSSFMTIDSPGAGTFTYKVKATSVEQLFRISLTLVEL